MKYAYTYRTTALDLWQLSMYYTYGSIVGVCNVIFTVAMLVLIITQWGNAGTLLRCLLIMGFFLFPVFQPLVVYGKARRQASAIKEDTTAVFDARGVHVTVGGQSSDTVWKQIKRVSRKPTMMIVFTDTTHGLILTNRILGAEKDEFYGFVSSHMSRK